MAPEQQGAGAAEGDQAALEGGGASDSVLDRAKGGKCPTAGLPWLETPDFSREITKTNTKKLGS